MQLDLQILTAGGGSNACPVTPAHPLLTERVACAGFHKVIWRPDGFRPDKAERYIAPSYRGAMIDIAFADVKRRYGDIITIDDSDLRSGIQTKTFDFIRQYRLDHPEEDFWWYMGSDCVVPLAKYNGKNIIQAKYYRGEELWESAQFLIVPRPGYPIPANLPNNCRVLPVYDMPEIASSTIWELIAKGQPWEHLYGGPDNEIVQIIKRNNLCGWRGE